MLQVVARVAPYSSRVDSDEALPTDAGVTGGPAPAAGISLRPAAEPLIAAAVVACTALLGAAVVCG